MVLGETVPCLKGARPDSRNADFVAFGLREKRVIVFYVAR
jgi:hypothetical protein